MRKWYRGKSKYPEATGAHHRKTPAVWRGLSAHDDESVSAENSLKISSGNGCAACDDQLALLYVGDGIDNRGRLIGEALDHLTRRDAGQNQHRVQAALDANQDIGVHSVADHDRVLRVLAEPP